MVALPTLEYVSTLGYVGSHVDVKLFQVSSSSLLSNQTVTKVPKESEIPLSFEGLYEYSHTVTVSLSARMRTLALTSTVCSSPALVTYTVRRNVMSEVCGFPSDDDS